MMTIKKHGITLFLLFSFIIPLSANEAKISLISHQEEAEILLTLFTESRNFFNETSRYKEKFINSHAGWKDEKGMRGFFIDGTNFFYSDTITGFSRIDENGNQKGYFQTRFQENGKWMDYHHPDAGYISAGYSNNQCFALFFTFPDGIKAEIWNESIKILLSPGDFYQRYTFNEEPLLFISPDLRNKIYRKNPNPDLIKALAEDFSFFYQVMILKEAYDNEIDLSNDQNAGLFAVNWLRRKIGLPEIKGDEKLSQSAKNHADYLLNNGIIGRMISWNTDTVDMDNYLKLHDETPGMPGFTGKTVRDRTEYTGAGSDTGENASFSGLNAIQENLAWFNSIYHRRPYMDFRVDRFGHGRAEGDLKKLETCCIADFHYTNLQSDSYYVYPYPGAKNVPGTFANFESPAPFSDSRPKGVPLTVNFQDSSYKKGELHLFGPEGRIPLLKTSVLEDPDNFIEAVPAEPLTPGTQYVLEFHYSGKKDKIPFTVAPENPAEILTSRWKKLLSR